MAGENFGMNPVTTRRITAPAQTVTETQVPTEYEDDLGLPFYYYNPTLSMMLIIIGVVLLIAQWMLGPLLIFAFFKKRKKYICLKCHREYKEKCEICSICGGEVVPEKKK